MTSPQDTEPEEEKKVYQICLIRMILFLRLINDEKVFMLLAADILFMKN